MTYDGIISQCHVYSKSYLSYPVFQAMICLLVFARDAMLNVLIEANWQSIRKRKQKRVDENDKSKQFHISIR